jgi:hypothetical protein
MALNLKDLGKKPASGQRAESAGTVQGKAAARPWQVESWEQPAVPAASVETPVAATSDELAAEPDVEIAPAVAAPAKPAAPAKSAAPTKPAVAKPVAPPAEFDDDSTDDAPTYRGQERRGARTVSTEDLDVSVDDVLAFVEELKVKLRNSQRSKRALEEVLAATKTKMEDGEVQSSARAREIAQLNQEIARVKAENERQLAELCRADDDRSEAALALKRLTYNLTETRAQIRAREEEITRLQTALANGRKLAESREQQVASSDAENVQRWRKFEEQLNHKDRDLFKARATIDELKHLKELAEARVARLEGSRAAIERIRTAVQAGRERRTVDSET